jgi:fermentation-respiration switch protein FrsA (DUF1100 family)
MRTDIEFLSQRTVLRGWLYRPANQLQPCPAIVMAHGFSGVKEQYLDRYAECFVAAGLAVLVYDHACFGASDGEPRQEIDPPRQKRGYRDAITFVQAQDGIDPARIGIWGTSLSGGYVLEIAAIDRRVRCVVSQVPQISGFIAAVNRSRKGEASPLLDWFAADRAARFKGDPPATIRPVTNDPTVPCAMGGADSYAFFTDTKPFAPAWRNEVTLRSVELVLEQEPGMYLVGISPTPLLVVLAEQDLLAPTDVALEAYQRALPPKQLVIIPGGHFIPYVEAFEQSSSAARDWFVQHLRPRERTML